MLWCHSDDGTEAKQTCKDEGPLTLERSKTVDEEISAKVVDFLDRNDPKKTNKPFFVWYNPARMHVTTVLPQKYQAMVGEPGGKDWGVNEAGHTSRWMTTSALSLRSSNTWVSSTTRSLFSPPTTGPRRSASRTGGVTPFKGQKGEAWEGGYRAPMVVRWPGHIKPGTVKNQLFAALDWLPTLVDIGGGPKDNALRTQIENGQYPGIVIQCSMASTSAVILKARRTSQRGSLLLFLWLDAVSRALQELEDVLHHVAAWTVRLEIAARFLPLHLGAEHQT